MASRSDIFWVSAQLILFVSVAMLALASGGSPPGGAVVAGVLCTAAGVVLAGAALARFGTGVSPFPTPRDDAALVTTGVYRLVRHPIYGGVVLMAIGVSVLGWSLPAFVASLGLVPFFVAKSSHEERMLAQAFDEYADYAARTRRRLIPWVV